MRMQIKQWVSISIVLLGMMASEQSYAAVNVDVTQMLINISTQLDPFMRLITGGAYVLGVGFVFRGIFLLKLYGQALTMSSTQTSLKGPIIFLVIGAGLIYFPTTLQVMLSSTFGQDNVLAYADWTGPKSFQGVTMDAIFKIVQVVGLVAFIRGWLLLGKGVQGGGGQNNFGKGVTHIIGGILAMNIIGTANMLSASLGVSFF